MSETIPLGTFDLTVFALYMVVTVALGFLVAGRHRKTAKGYFLGDRQLPWYVVGTSMIAADISSDDLIANAGGAYQYGIVLGAGSWNAWIIYSLLIWIFLPLHISTILFFAVYLTLRGQGRVIWKAIFDAIRGLPKMIQKRKAIQKNKKVKSGDLLKVMSTGLFEPLQEFMQRNKG